jgi:predicted ribosomally synthesized peptide with SipW-like signal peptide
MKKKVLLSSIATIALCLCLIAGSTFALFTSQSSVNIAVTAAKVEMTADIANLALASVRPATVAEVRAADDGQDIKIIEDEFGGQYVYSEREDGTFANGGTVNFENAVLTLDLITPGDKVSFDVVGANTSDVTIQYRYVIECIEGKELMSGLLISVDGITYEFLGSYTSGWKTLTPETDITPVPVVVEFPVTAGNEFQGLSTSIKVTVEAIQGNADVAGSDQPVVEFLDGVSVDLAGRTMPINAGVVNTGNLELSNGSIVIDEVGFENYGNATLTNVAIDGGASGTIAYGYGVIGGANSVTVLNDVTINSANGAIAATDGAELTFNGGYVEVDSSSTSGRYLFYVVGEGTVTTINDGEFFFSKTQNQKRAYAYVGEGATLYINGGNFGTASTRSGYTAGILGEGTIIITGGTFGFDPSAWVADGYVATESNGVWTVNAQ